VRIRSVHLPTSKDTRLLVAGVAAFVALVAYLGVALANTRAPVDLAREAAPWLPHGSKFSPSPSPSGRGFVVRVTPEKSGNYGALVPTLVSGPESGRTYAIGLWLKGTPGQIGVSVDEFAPGATSVYVVNTTVLATRRWRHFTFSARVKGSWLGLGMYVYRIDQRSRTWFSVRRPTVSLR
jgi:hypothetical protein